MKKIINWTFGSVFRTLGRVLTYLALGGLIAFICVKNDIKITQLFGLETIKADTITLGSPQGYNGYIWTCSQFNCSGGHNYVETGLTNFGTSATIDTTQASAVYIQTIATVYSYSFNKSNTYTINFRIHLGGNNHDLDIIKNDQLYRNWYFGVYGYKNSTEGYIDDYINSASCSVRYDETTSNGFLAQCNVALNSNVSRIRITTGFPLMNNNYIPYTFSSIRVNLIGAEETTGQGALIDKQTNQLIDNQNNNTNRVITNQNENTDRLIESNKVCNLINKDNIKINGKKLTSDGGYIDSSTYGITDYIKLGLSLERSISGGGPSAYLCWYNSNKVLLSCIATSSIPSGQLSPPSNAYYFRSSIDITTNTPQFKLCNNGNQATSDSINNLNDTLTDDDITGSKNEASSFFNSFSTNTHGLTGIITAPLNAIQSLTSKTCSPLVLPLPFVNQNLTLPCMRPIYNQWFGNFMTLYDLITLGIVSYWIMVRIFSLVKDFKNPEHDEIEVMEL